MAVFQTPVAVCAPQFNMPCLFIPQINSIIDQSEEWKAEAHAQFVKPDYTHTLLDVLLPRHTKQPAPKSNARRRKQKQAGGETSSQSITGSTEKLIDKVKLCIALCSNISIQKQIDKTQILTICVLPMIISQPLLP